MSSGWTARLSSTQKHFTSKLNDQKWEIQFNPKHNVLKFLDQILLSGASDTACRSRRLLQHSTRWLKEWIRLKKMRILCRNYSKCAKLRPKASFELCIFSIRLQAHSTLTVYNITFIWITTGKGYHHMSWKHKNTNCALVTSPKMSIDFPSQLFTVILVLVFSQPKLCSIKCISEMVF